MQSYQIQKTTANEGSFFHKEVETHCFFHESDSEWAYVCGLKYEITVLVSKPKSFFKTWEDILLVWFLIIE